ncbi:unnamed protein product [Ilex paraguariensis]|uniref:Uncharacterized protein n=1 Tax=Ilex paraguariensis TaxID=185542 RepID=A0ABC8SDC5_9AQUA
MAPAGGSSLVPSLPPPRPKPPPECPNLYGKRRELARIQMMEAEIGFLESMCSSEIKRERYIFFEYTLDMFRE